MKDFLNQLVLFGGIYFLALGIPALFITACMDDVPRPVDDGTSTTGTITLSLNEETGEYLPMPSNDPCDEEYTVHARWCYPDCNWWNPDGPHGNPIVEECLQPYFQESFDFETGIWSFRSTVPVCDSYLLIEDSECEWLHDGYVWAISQTDNFWEGMVRFPEEWIECVSQYDSWCFEISLQVICPN
jgi:hypothetical protein